VCHWSDDDCVRAMKRAARRGYLTAVMYQQAYERAPAGSMPSLPHRRCTGSTSGRTRSWRLACAAGLVTPTGNG
jgi:hypothetical protein